MGSMGQIRSMTVKKTATYSLTYIIFSSKFQYRYQHQIPGQPDLNAATAAALSELGISSSKKGVKNCSKRLLSILIWLWNEINQTLVCAQLIALVVKKPDWVVFWVFTDCKIISKFFVGQSSPFQFQFQIFYGIFSWLTCAIYLIGHKKVSQYQSG